MPTAADPGPLLQSRLHEIASTLSGGALGVSVFDYRSGCAWQYEGRRWFHAADRRATALTKTLTVRQLNWKPDPGVWSVGQCLEHLCAANEMYLPALSGALTGRTLAVVPEITPGWFGRWFIRNYIEPSSSTRRVRAPKKVTPAA